MKDVTAAIIIENSRILLTRRRDGETNAGYWEFPGGKVEVGESLAQCLERELREELGVETSAGEVLTTSEYRYDGGAIRLFAFRAEITDGDIRLSVHDRAEWVPLEELLDYRLSPADIPIARWIVAHLERETES